MTIDDMISMRLRRAYLTMHRVAQAHFAPFGVTVDQYVLLSLLADEDGETQSKIAERMSSDVNTIGAMLRLLEQKGLVSRERCEADGRARRTFLTTKGRRLQTKLMQSAVGLHESIDNAVSASERSSLFSTLNRLTAALSQGRESERRVG